MHFTSLLAISRAVRLLEKGSGFSSILSSGFLEPEDLCTALSVCMTMKTILYSSYYSSNMLEKIRMKLLTVQGPIKWEFLRNQQNVLQSYHKYIT